MLPTTADNETTHENPLRTIVPMTSSQGLNASGNGRQIIFLSKLLINVVLVLSHSGFIVAVLFCLYRSASLLKSRPLLKKSFSNFPNALFVSRFLCFKEVFLSEGVKEVEVSCFVVVVGLVVVAVELAVVLPACDDFKDFLYVSQSIVDTA